MLNRIKLILMKLIDKKYRKLFCIVLVLMAFSCQDLIETPNGSLVNSSFFKTEADLTAAVTAAYRPLIDDPWGGYGSTRMWIPLMGADDLTTHPASNKQDFREFDQFTGTSLNPALMGSAWKKPYAIIYAANNVLENYEKIEGRESFINQSVAQVRFLRAFAYFWMTRVYGDLPLVKTITTDLEIQLSPVADIYALIVEDLQFAKENLPPSWAGEPGKPNSWTAKSLLAQVYLTMGGWPLKDESKYALAAAEAKDVIDNGPYVLLDNFADLWLMKNDNNNEFIWSIQMTGISGNPQLSTITGYTTMPGEESGWDDVMFEVGFYNRFPAGLRKDATFHTQFQNGPTAPVIDFKNSTTKHPYIAKYRDGALTWLPSYEHKYMTSRNVNHLRFAEILLCYAEAQAMADGSPNSFAYQCVNRVRTRAGLGNLTSGLGKIAFRDALIDERGWELAAEYSRWFDLIRTEKVEAMTALKDPVDLPPLGPVSKAKYHAPIPYSEVLLNPNLANSTQY